MKINLFKLIYIILFMIVYFAGSTFLIEYSMVNVCLLSLFAIFNLKFNFKYKLFEKNKSDLFLIFIMILIDVYLFFQLSISFRPETTLVYLERFIAYSFLIIYTPKIYFSFKLLNIIRIYSLVVAFSIIIIYVLTGEKTGGLLGSYQYAGLIMSIAFGLFLISYYNDKKRVDILGMLVALLALVISGKRTLIFISGIAFVLIFILSCNRKKYEKLMYLMLLFCIIGTISFFTVPAVKSTIERFKLLTVDSTGTGRTYYWDAAKIIYSQNKSVGIGMGCFRFYFDNNFHRYGNMEAADAHNIYLQMAAEVGYIGASIFIVLFSYSLIRTIKLLKCCKNDVVESFICIYSIFIQIWFIIYGFTGNPLYQPDLMFIYITSISITIPIKQKNKLLGEKNGIML